MKVLVTGGAAVHDAAMQVGGWRKGDGVQHEVKLSPALLKLRKHCFELAGLLHIERQDEVGFKLLGQRPDMRFGLGVEIGDGQRSAELVHDLGAAVGNALVVGNADDEAFFAGQYR